MTTKMMPVAANNDAELVSGTLAGNRDAFAQIVSRYQSLICALAYSATGSLGQSEDLAPETCITAWKHLGHLRKHNKLRAWLCGIAPQPYQWFSALRRPQFAQVNLMLLECADVYFWGASVPFKDSGFLWPIYLLFERLNN